MPVLSRAWKHTKRLITKPFVPANKPNLMQLENVLSKISPGKYPGDLFFSQPNLFQFSVYDFTWLLALNQNEFNDMNGEWKATLQSFAASQSTGSAAILSAATRGMLFNATGPEADKSLWFSLQDIKYRYANIAKINANGFCLRLANWVEVNKAKISDKIYHNKRFGYYATQYQAANYVYEDCQKAGATNPTERKILEVGGLYKACKAGYGIALAGARVTGGDLSQVKKVVQKSVVCLNHLGGVIAGITDLLRGHEEDYRRLSARFGLEQKLEDLKQKYLGPEDQGSLLEQTQAGPQRLERASDILIKELDPLREALKHSLWWCQNWKLDIKEIKREIDAHDHIRELSARFTILKGDEVDQIIKPSEFTKMVVAETTSKEVLQGQVDALDKRIHEFDYLLDERIKKLDNLLAGYDTRRGIAKTQKTLASSGVAYDAPRQLASEIKTFDKSTLSPVSKTSKKSSMPLPETIGTSKQMPSGKLPAGKNPSLHQILSLAMVRRREAIDEEFDDWDDEWLDD